MTQLRAVIYARYSSDLQREASIEDQFRICRARAAAEGWTIVETYADLALSGSTSFRPRYQQMLTDARAGKFDIVLAEGLDRLSRDQENVAGLYKALQFSRVLLVTLADGVVSELHVGLKGTMNALFLKDLAAKTHRGMLGRIEKGRSAGGISFGYRIRREFDIQGEPIRGGRDIDPEQAKVIIRIFELFAAGQSPRAIARKLNGEHIPGPRRNRWQDTTIRGHGGRGTGILRNEIYLGRLVWNRMTYVRDPNSGKRLSRVNPRDQWVVEEVPELQIVSQALWDSCADRLQDLADSPASRALKAGKFWLKKRPRHVLSGLVKCGHCGENMVIVGQDYLRCGSANRNSGCASLKLIRRSSLEDIVLEALRSNLMAPELVSEFIREVHNQLELQHSAVRSDRQEIERQLKRVEQQLEGLINAITDGLRGVGIQSRLDSLEGEKVRLSAQLIEPASNVIRLHPNLADIYRAKVQALQESLNHTGDRDTAFGILRSLIEQVTVLPTETGMEVELIGDIAAMVEMAANKNAAPTGAAFSTELQRSVKVVAGAGNHRELTISCSI